jgi:hypothetical protein
MEFAGYYDGKSAAERKQILQKIYKVGHLPTMSKRVNTLHL